MREGHGARLLCLGTLPSMTKGLPSYKIMAGTFACQTLIIRMRKERDGLAS